CVGTGGRRGGGRRDRAAGGWSARHGRRPRADSVVGAPSGGVPPRPETGREPRPVRLRCEDYFPSEGMNHSPLARAARRMGSDRDGEDPVPLLDNSHLDDHWGAVPKPAVALTRKTGIADPEVLEAG